ncbi:MAG: GNAT family N-acetyltransferase [Gammaproteobacteria bacterium]|nr:GNAT family N-acetyltransferase [Gammaproteobacteria bacterium]MDH5803500.1 GNAT family N-acetyltransferase [Gammaproteobacteria bacterium]
MADIQIAYLAKHQQMILPLAQWIYAHWRPLGVDGSLADRKQKLLAHCNMSELPLALVAHKKNQVMGTAALRVEDLPGREDLTPWLGGVFVGAEFRGRGVGRKLCVAIEEEAKRRAMARLHLFTLDRQSWYESMGWQIVEPCEWCGELGSVMVKDLSFGK